MFTVTSEWKQTYPDACMGVLVMRGVTNPPAHPGLEEKKRELEADLRALFPDKAALKDQAPIKAYADYYKKFKKTYHVTHQLESVAVKNQAIPDVAGLVEAMFMAELRNMILTAGHDLDAVLPPVTLTVATGEESYVTIRGSGQTLKPGDMYVRDRKGVLSSIVYGPDQRTKIVPATTSVLFTAYGVPGITFQAMQQHLEGIAANVRVFSLDAHIEVSDVHGAR